MWGTWQFSDPSINDISFAKVYQIKAIRWMAVYFTEKLIKLGRKMED